MFEKVLISDKVHNPHLLNEMETILQVITQIRAFRSNLKISPNQPIEIFVKTQNEYLFQNYFPILQKLANLQSLQFVNDAVSGTTKILVFTHELYIPFQLDEKKIQEELQKLQKELDSAQKLYESATQKLSNEKFLANAKAELVEKEKQKQVDAQKRIASITESINELKSKIS
jgi:valyl-tRNA synthetase